MTPRQFCLGKMWRRTGLAVLVGAITWVVAASLAAHGEDDRVVDEAVENGAETSGQNAGQIMDYDLGENFDRNVFDAFAQPHVASFGFSPRTTGKVAANEPAAAAVSATVAKVRACVEPQFNQIATMVELSEPQVRKLRLALESGISQAADEIHVVRQNYRGVVLKVRNWGQDPKQQQLMVALQNDAQRCRDRLKQVCGSEAFFAKAIRSTLDVDQQARLTAAIEGRLDYLWRSIVARQMLKFDASLGLDQRQHEALEALLVQARPPLQHSFGTAPRVPQYADHLVRLAIVEIGNERLRTAVSERQAQVLGEFARQGAGQQQFLESQGVLQKRVS